MNKFVDTMPMWKMPNDMIIPHTHRVTIRRWAKSLPKCWLVDIMDCYDWAVENGIELEHRPLQMGEDKKRTSIAFSFWTAEDAMAFKLRWA